MNRHSFNTSDLDLISKAPPPDKPPLMMGETCKLNSGGPLLLIVDLAGDDLVVSWRCTCGVPESKVSRATVRRAAAL